MVTIAFYMSKNMMVENGSKGRMLCTADSHLQLPPLFSKQGQVITGQISSPDKKPSAKHTETVR